MQEHGLKTIRLKRNWKPGRGYLEILTGKRTLNIEQVKKISNKFHVSPLVFI